MSAPNEVPILIEIGEILGIDPRYLVGQTEVPLLEQIRNAIALLVGNTGSGLPTQTGHAGEFLTTDGATASWAAIPAATPGGAANTLQFNNAGAFGGVSGWTTNGTTTVTGNILSLAAGSAAAPSLNFGTAGTGIYGPTNSTVGFAITGALSHSMTTDSMWLRGAVNPIIYFGSTPDLILTKKAAATLQLGADAAGVVNQMFTAANRIASDGVGANLTIAPGNGLGGAGGSLILATFTTAATGVAGTLTTRFTLTGATLTGGTGAALENTIIGGTTPAAGTFTTLNSTGDATLAGNLTTISSISGISLTGGMTIGNQGSGANYYISSTGFQLAVGKILSFSGDANATVSPDVILLRDAANTLALRNGANAQTFRLYNTYTDGSNWERGDLAWIANDLYLATGNAGTGAVRGLKLQAAGALGLTANGGTVGWNINTSGHFLAATDNTYDIGASGATRPRNVYVAGTVTAGAVTSAAAVTGSILSASSRFEEVNGRFRLSSAVDGRILLQDAAMTSFGLIQFGGTTAAFPALKRSGDTIQVRAADDSAYAFIDAASYIVGGVSGVSAGPFTTITSITVVGGIITDLQGS